MRLAVEALASKDRHPRAGAEVQERTDAIKVGRVDPPQVNGPCILGRSENRGLSPLV